MEWSASQPHYFQRNHQHTGDQLPHVDFFEFCRRWGLALQYTNLK